MSRERGFTLLELLIGLTLLTFMLALAFAGFRLASDSWDTIDRGSSRTADEEMGRAAVRRLITQLQPLRWKKGVDRRLAFVGDRELLRAVASPPGPAELGGLQVIELASEHDDRAGPDALRMVMRIAPVRYDLTEFTEGLEEAKAHTLLGDLTAVEFAYFGAPKRGETPQWFSTWPTSDRLPQLVRVRLGSRDAGWSDLLITPMVSGAQCNWDNFYKICR